MVGFIPHLKMIRDRFKSVENGSKTMKNHLKMEPICFFTIFGAPQK
jgi:hypothetical protein